MLTGDVDGEGVGTVGLLVSPAIVGCDVSEGDAVALVGWRVGAAWVGMVGVVGVEELGGVVRVWVEGVEGVLRGARRGG